MLSFHFVWLFVSALEYLGETEQKVSDRAEGGSSGVAEWWNEHKPETGMGRQDVPLLLPEGFFPALAARPFYRFNALSRLRFSIPRLMPCGLNPRLSG